MLYEVITLEDRVFLGHAGLFSLIPRLALFTVTVVTVIAVIILLMLALPLFLLARKFALRLAQHTGVVLGVLEEVLLGHPVIAELRIAGEHQVFVA